MKVTVIKIVISTLGMVPKRLVKGLTGRHGNKMTIEDQPDYSIIKIGQNTEKNFGDLRWLLSLKLQWETNS